MNLLDIPLDQVGIAALGVTAIFLSQDSREAVRRWACVFGLCGQPFWFYATVTTQQWGMVFVCCLYTVSWARGVKTNWVQPYLDRRTK